MSKIPPTTVVHVNDPGDYDVYIGRPNRRRGLAGSAWANPFVIGRDGDRAEVIAMYEVYLLLRGDLRARIGELRGKRLACWCAPLACHGHVLARLADGLASAQSAATVCEPCGVAHP